MRLIKYEFTEDDERLPSHSGLALIGAILNRTRLKERLSETILPYCREPKISHSDIIYAATGLICLGKPDYDAIEPFRDNPFFTQKEKGTGKGDGFILRTDPRRTVPTEEPECCRMLSCRASGLLKEVRVRERNRVNRGTGTNK